MEGKKGPEELEQDSPGRYYITGDGRKLPGVEEVYSSARLDFGSGCSPNLSPKFSKS